jgi:hypothetical protein
MIDAIKNNKEKSSGLPLRLFPSEDLWATMHDLATEKDIVKFALFSGFSLKMLHWVETFSIDIFSLAIDPIMSWLFKNITINHSFYARLSKYDPFPRNQKFHQPLAPSSPPCLFTLLNFDTAPKR